MEIIAHRRNTINELKSTPMHFGVEVDVRSYLDELIVEHDPFKKGESFNSWLSNYKNGTLIVNVKEEGLEERVLSLLEAYEIESYFFLDQSFPFLLKTAKRGIDSCAIRVSEFESVETALNLAGMVSWVWLDMFGSFPLAYEGIKKLKNAGFKICLVSPELHSINRINEITLIKEVLHKINFIPDAVCTKCPEYWIAT